MGNEAVVVEAVRSPIGKRKGSLAGIHPADLSAHVLRAVIERSGIDPALVDDVIWGCVLQGGEQAGNIGRTAVLAAGLPETIPAVTINRACGSSQQSISFAAASVSAGHQDFVIAGGVESMSRGPALGAPGRSPADPDSVLERYGVDGFHQGIGAEMVADRWNLSRTALDEYSVRSHELSAAAIDRGAFDTQIAAVPGALEMDEGVRRGTTVDKLAALPTVFDPDNGVIHAGNASQISDGAGALLITTADTAAAHGMTPIAKIHTVALAADDPVIMLTGPIGATAKALARSGLSIDDIGAFEVNEAFAPVPLAWLAETGADLDRVNPVGGAISVGHPLGGSGAILATRLIHHMRDQDLRYGLQTMCEAGGMANATIFELL